MLEILQKLPVDWFSIIVTIFFILATLMVLIFRNKEWFPVSTPLAVSLTLLATFVLYVISAFLEKFSKYKFADTVSDWGAVGDYFGGMLNPILAFASFMALLYTIRIQSEELRLTRSELAASRLAQEGSSKALEGQLANLVTQQFESTFFSLIGQIRLASLKPEDKDTIISKIIKSAKAIANKKFESDLDRVSELSLTIFDNCNSVRSFEISYLSLMTSSIVYVDENLESDDKKRKYLSILSIYANEVESYLLYLWLAKFNSDPTGERKKARDVLNKYGFFRELITFSAENSMNCASVLNVYKYSEQLSMGQIHVRQLLVKLDEAGYFSSCILGSPYPETILPVDISPQ